MERIMGAIDFGAVLLAASAAFVVGSLWYGLLFGKAWRAELGIAAGAGPRRSMGLLLGGNFILLCASAFMLGHMFARNPELKSFLYFMMAGGVAAFFIVPSLWINYLYQGRSMRLALIDAGYWLTAYLAMGAAFWLLR
jgi:Protein of unknown function (DUF1761)